MIISKSPTTEEVIKTFGVLTKQEVDERLSAAQQAFHDWKNVPLAQRARLMKALAKELRLGDRHYAELMTLEMGKPIKQALAEVEKCAWACEWFAEHAERLLAEEHVQSDASESLIRFEPLGIVLAVMPWNFPFWQVVRFAAPALMAGNVGILKHASNVPQCSLALEEAFKNAGFPHAVFQSLLIDSSAVESVIDDPRVKAVTLTGSEHAGSMVASQAAKRIKKSVLELGGSDPFIVLEDADIVEAVKTATTARLQNNGQSCIAAKRFIVVEIVAKAFLDQFVNQFKSMIVGDPMNEQTNVGPLATEHILNDIEKQVNDSVAMGARVLVGGKRKEGKGYFYEPTILMDVKPGMPAYNQELFGPVATAFVVEDENEALEIANATDFGLGASLWTKDIKRAKRLTSRIDAGCVFVNAMVKSDPRLPFGGIKHSGYGRELSHYGIKEFVNVKTIWVK